MFLVQTSAQYVSENTYLIFLSSFFSPSVDKN